MMRKWVRFRRWFSWEKINKFFIDVCLCVKVYLCEQFFFCRFANFHNKFINLINNVTQSTFQHKTALNFQQNSFNKIFFNCKISNQTADIFFSLLFACCVTHSISTCLHSTSHLRFTAELIQNFSICDFPVNFDFNANYLTNNNVNNKIHFTFSIFLTYFLQKNKIFSF